MAVWGYGLLGPVEVQANGGAIEFAGARQRLILAMLLLAANQQVPAGRLVDELWGEALPADPAGALRTQISRLRRALGPAGDSLITVEGGYRLSLQRASSMRQVRGCPGRGRGRGRGGAGPGDSR